MANMLTHDQQALVARLQSALYVYTVDGLWFAVYQNNRRGYLNMRAIPTIVTLDLIRMGLLVKRDDHSFYLAGETYGNIAGETGSTAC